MFFTVFYEVLRVQDITFCYFYCVLRGFVNLKRDFLLFFNMFYEVLRAQYVLTPLPPPGAFLPPRRKEYEV